MHTWSIRPACCYCSAERCPAVRSRVEAKLALVIATPGIGMHVQWPANRLLAIVICRLMRPLMLVYEQLLCGPALMSSAMLAGYEAT